MTFPRLQCLLIFGLLVALGMLGNHFKFTLFFNADFIFGSIFAMLALQIFGTGLGSLAALAISLPLFLLWGHPYGIVIMTAEVAVVGWLNARHRLGFIQADALYWLFLGMPLVYLFYHFVMKVPQGNTLFIMAKDMVNGLAAVLVARLAFSGITLLLHRWPIGYREAIYNTLAFFVLGPALLLLAMESRQGFRATDQQTRAALIQDGQRIEGLLEAWARQRKLAMVQVAELASRGPAQRMQVHVEQAKKSDANFLRIGLLDQTATSYAFYPTVDELGHPTIGKNWADRPFIPVLEQTLKPMLSEVVMARVGKPMPVVSMLAPVVIGGRYHGYAIGVLSLSRVHELLDQGRTEKDTRFTLLDRNDRVIMTNRSDQKVMAPFVWGKGTRQRLDDRISQWVPVMPPNTPAMERWGKSFYVAESQIGDLGEWKLILEQPVAPFQRALFDRYSWVLSVLLLLVIVSLVVAEIASNLMTRSLEALGGLTQNLPDKLSSESPDIRWPESGILESSHLISHFRVMAESLSEQFKKVQTANETLEQRVEERTHELLVSQEKFRTVADFAHDWEYWVAEDGSIPWMSPSCERITGYSIEDFKQDPDLLYRICHPDDLSLLLDHVHEVPGKLSFSPIEFRIHHRDGQEVWFSHLCTPVWDDSGNPTGRRVTNRDITDRKLADIALRDSEARLLRAENVARIGNWELDLVEQMIRGSRGASRIYGLQGDTWPLPEIQDLALPEYRPALDAALAGLLKHGRAFDVEYCIRRVGDGERRWIHSKAEYDVARRTVFGVISDITQRKRDQEDKQKLLTQVQQAQKMESLGTLAGGIAHDMNNVLGAILGLASANLETQPPGTPSYRSFETIAKAATRGGDMVKSLLSFARQSPTREQALDLNTILREQVLLLERTTLSNVRLEMDLEPELRLMQGDASSLTLALINLCVNSVHAMPEDGTLTLRTRNLASGWVEVLVKDTGIGMSKEVLDRALEPFFTTKEVGKGTGLGLSMVYSMVEAHRGQMEIQSEPGKGTGVSLRFPACEPMTRVMEQRDQPPSEPRSRALNVLVVDDDELIQSSMENLLRALGHAVVTAPSGEVALTTIEGGFSPDVVILDMNMPGLGGTGTLPHLRNLLPEVPILLSTGRADQAALDLAGSYPQVSLLSKPFTLKELKQRLEALGR